MIKAVGTSRFYCESFFFYVNISHEAFIGSSRHANGKFILVNLKNMTNLYKYPYIMFVVAALYNQHIKYHTALSGALTGFFMLN